MNIILGWSVPRRFEFASGRCLDTQPGSCLCSFLGLALPRHSNDSTLWTYVRAGLWLWTFRRGFFLLTQFPGPERWLITISCCCSVTKSCLTLCNPMACRTPGSSVLHCLPEFDPDHRSVGKVISLLFNILSRFVIALLTRSKRLLISWLAVTICSDFWTQENKTCHSFSSFPFYLPWWDWGLGSYVCMCVY